MIQMSKSNLIDQQAAIDAIMGQPPEPHYPSWYAEQIKALPSVKPRKGKWIKDRDGIYHCSCCGTDYLMYELAVKDTHYCPNCGCRMEEGGSE